MDERAAATSRAGAPEPGGSPGKADSAGVRNKRRLDRLIDKSHPVTSAAALSFRFVGLTRPKLACEPGATSMGTADSPRREDLDLFAYEPVLRAAAAHLCRKAWETDDLVQDTFERALRYLSSGRPLPVNPRAWLVSILRNAFIDRIRRSAVRFEAMTETETQTRQPDSDPEPAWAKLSVAEVQIALAELDAEQREVFELHYIAGLSYRDIAERMAIPQNTVASRLFRARKALRRVLDRDLTGATR